MIGYLDLMCGVTIHIECIYFSPEKELVEIYISGLWVCPICIIESFHTLIILEKWFPLQGERGHSSNFQRFKKKNREEVETE